MYNRYIPQPDGSYQRKRHLDYTDSIQPQRQASPNTASNSQSPRPSSQSPQQSAVPSQQSALNSQPHNRSQMSQQSRNNPYSVGTFFKNLLPKEFDTGDLLILLLILLITGDCEEDRNNAILTMALYLFL